MPSAEPSAVPRSTAGQACLKSSLLGQRFLTLLVKTSRFSFISRLAMISVVPNMPMATITKPMPSESSGMSKVKRSTPELTSVPTMPNSRPQTTIAIALTSEPCASTVAAIRPNTISEKYSEGPNLSATSASGGAATAMTSVATQPAKNEPSAATGFRLNVIGRSMAMVATGPMPGSTPISVPRIQPMNAYSRLIGDTATPNPIQRLANSSIALAPYLIGQLATKSGHSGKGSVSPLTNTSHENSINMTKRMMASFHLNSCPAKALTNTSAAVAAMSPRGFMR